MKQKEKIREKIRRSLNEMDIRSLQNMEERLNRLLGSIKDEVNYLADQGGAPQVFDKDKIDPAVTKVSGELEKAMQNVKQALIYLRDV